MNKIMRMVYKRGHKDNEQKRRAVETGRNVKYRY